MDTNMLYGRISQLAPEWDPFPVLQALDQMPPGVGQNTMSPGSAYGWADPQAQPVPQLPVNQQPAGVQMMVPPGQQMAADPTQGPGLAPLTTQQLLAMNQIAQSRQGVPMPPRAPAATPHRPGQVQLQPIQLPQAALAQRPQGFAQLFGRRG